MALWRVATFNIRHGLGRDGRVDLDRTAGEIAALRADAIGLQEVDVGYGPRSDHEDQAARLGELLGWQVAFGAALDLPPGEPGRPRRRYGVALLTPHTLTHPVMHPLPDHPGAPAPHEMRGALSAQVSREGGERLQLLVTHLDSAVPAHRNAEVLGLLRLGEGIAGPAVLLGDLNAAPHHPELAPLAAAGWREAAQELRTARDAARRNRRGVAARRRGTADEGTGGRSAPRLLERLPALAPLVRDPARPTHPARFPVRRIDSLWVRGPVVVQDLETGPLTASDHRPVVATLAT